MKTFIAIFFISILPNGCNKSSSSLNELQKRQDNIVITYQAVSRGFFEQISISKDSITISNDRNKKDIKTYNSSTKSWNTCLELLSKIDINNLPKLKAPTTYRHVDGAAHATLIITDGDKEIKSIEFDHGYPPQKIKELVEKLLTFKKIVSKQ